MLFSTSMSEMFVSSKPGVSIKMILRPARMNTSVRTNLEVHDFNPCPTSNSDPLAALMNWKRDSKLSHVITLSRPSTTYGRFPCPCGTHYTRGSLLVSGSGANSCQGHTHATSRTSSSVFTLVILTRSCGRMLNRGQRAAWVPFS